MTDRATTEQVATVFRMESARIIAGVARIVQDVGIAEELAQDALVEALERWPVSGIPDNPAAWLTTIARRRAVDLIRRKETYARKLAEVGRTATEAVVPDPSDIESVDGIDDDVFRLIFTACHPVLSPQARTTLTLRLVAGLSTAEIARAYLVAEPTVAQRITRAKRTLAQADVAFEAPQGAERAERVASVLDVIYLIFNEGYAATAGEDLLRPVLCEDALRLARVLAALMPYEPEAHGLAALLEFQASRTPARTTSDGEPVLLAEQDRTRWHHALIRRGFAALQRAGTGAYSLQAAIAGCHAAAPEYADTDWATIAVLYARLAKLTPSPVVEINRAVAVAMCEGPAAGLRLLDPLTELAPMRSYHLLPSVRGDLLERLGRNAEASTEYARAADLTGNVRERTLLTHRAQRTRNAAANPDDAVVPAPPPGR